MKWQILSLVLIGVLAFAARDGFARDILARDTRLDDEASKVLFQALASIRNPVCADNLCTLVAHDVRCSSWKDSMRSNYQCELQDNAGAAPIMVSGRKARRLYQGLQDTQVPVNCDSTAGHCQVSVLTLSCELRGNPSEAHEFFCEWR